MADRMARRGIDRITISSGGRTVETDLAGLRRAAAIAEGRARMGRRTAKDIPVIPAEPDAEAGASADAETPPRVEKRTTRGPSGTEQHLITGTGPLVDPEMDGLADEAAAIRATIQGAREQLAQCDARIVAAMLARKIRVYESSDGVVLLIESREKIVVQAPANE